MIQCKSFINWNCQKLNLSKHLYSEHKVKYAFNKQNLTREEMQPDIQWRNCCSFKLCYQNKHRRVLPGVDRDTRSLDSRFWFDQPASQCKNPARQELEISLYFKAKIFIRPISWQLGALVDAGLVQIILEVKNNSVTDCHNCH